MQTAVDVTKTRVMFVEGRIMRTDACWEKYEPIHKGNVDYYFSNFIPSCMAEWKLACAHNVVWNGVLPARSTRYEARIYSAIRQQQQPRSEKSRKVWKERFTLRSIFEIIHVPSSQVPFTSVPYQLQLRLCCYDCAIACNATQACTSSKIKMTFVSLLPLQMTAY